MCRLLASVPPLFLALVSRRLSSILELCGVLGVFVAFVTPALLQLRSSDWHAGYRKALRGEALRQRQLQEEKQRRDEAEAAQADAAAAVAAAAAAAAPAAATVNASAFGGRAEDVADQGDDVADDVDADADVDAEEVSLTGASKHNSPPASQAGASGAPQASADVASERGQGQQRGGRRKRAPLSRLTVLDTRYDTPFGNKMSHWPYIVGVLCLAAVTACTTVISVLNAAG